MNVKQEQIFNDAYKKYSELLLRIIKVYIKDENECEDILQEVFLKLLIKAPKFESPEHEKHWLIRVAINKSKDYHRTFWKRKIQVTDKDAYFEIESKTTDMEDYIVDLPKMYKDIVVLYYYFGYSIAEIANIVKLKESAVKMRLMRARKYIKIEMEGNYE